MYAVKFLQNSAFLNHKKLKHFSNIKQLTLSSNEFDDFNECETKFNLLMGHLASIENRDKVKNKNCIVVTLKRSDATDDEIFLQWEDRMIMKKMIIEAEKGIPFGDELTFTVFGAIYSVGESPTLN